MIEKPFFLVGSERSGTTLVRLMLNHHPKIAWLDEFEYAVDLVGEEGVFPPLEEYYEWLETDRIFQSTGFVVDRQLDYPHLVNSFLWQKKEREGKPIVGATVHRNFDRILYIWPSAAFIHIIRDPRDVARSCVDMGWAGSVWCGVDRWLEAEYTWNRLREKIPPDRCVEIHYEDLIENPVAVLSGICSFIGVEYDGAMLSYPKDSTYSLPDASLVGQWRKRLSNFEIQLVESKVGDLLVDRGYQKSGLPPITVNSTTRKWLQVYDWWYRLQFRIKRFGLPLVLADFLSRKLGLKQWQKRVKLAINEVQKRHLK
ncbi:MAG: sulfotransferase [Geminocystis sp.]|nr:sulfotransferase [Geminocystis sp.]MCS7147889.1 sulfotransferase [Geminocystis sp.]MDW8117023.1 sulfotransferase [Geminocystis sp.]